MSAETDPRGAKVIALIACARRASARSQPSGVFALSVPNPKLRVERAAHGAVAMRADSARIACMARQGFLPPKKNEEERQKARRNGQMSGGPQRIPKGFAQKVRRRRAEARFHSRPRRRGRVASDGSPAAKAQAPTMEKRESMQEMLMSKDA